MAKIEGDVIVSTTTGRTALVMPREADEVEPSTTLRDATREGRIYTDLKDMPSLETLLAEYHVATAVIWKEPVWPIEPRRIVSTSAVAGGITAVGAALLLVDLAGTAHPNPYVSLMLLLGGFGLLATIVVALRTTRR